MSRYLVDFVVFLAGLAVVGWVATSYVGTNGLALAVTLLIGAFYLAGALEVLRSRQATAALARAVAGLEAPPASLPAWLECLPEGLRNAVRLRIEGARTALPGPALAPYVVGLLVLLGMLGTFLGMVATLRGTGAALESAADLQAIRASLAAPVRGLGFAFGTSVAGVATSAMLGLLSALARRARIEAGQLLDARIATTLRPYTPAQQRTDTFMLLQRQADAMPAMVERLQAMMDALERRSEALDQRLLAGHEAFHAKADAAYARLAGTIEASLRENAAAGARAAGAAIQPAVEATMASLAREAAALREGVAGSAQQQLEALTSRVEASAATTAELWQAALADHRRASETLAERLQDTLGGFAETFAQRTDGLIEQISGRLDTTTGRVEETWNAALARQEQAGRRLADDHRQAMRAAAEAFAQQAAALLRSLDQSHADQRAALAQQDAQRLQAWAGSLNEMAGTLRQEWQQAGSDAAQRQRQICDALAQAAADISAQTQAHAQGTLAEIATLVQAAAEAPRAAAEITTELRRKLADSMARDNAMLEERNRLLETLETLLGAINHVSNDQRAAVEALVAASADLVERVGAQLTGQIEAETGKLATVSAQVTGSAVEVASLGEAFGAAVQQFSQANAELMQRLERVETALDKSLARSDEQLAYYVAQAKEVVDLSLASQKQIVEDLQQLAGQRAAAGAEAA